MSRVFAIGDVHGCLTSLETLDSHLAFGPDDQVIALGDYVDRGPDSKGVIDHLIGLQKRARLVALRGNHEVMMLSARGGGLESLEYFLNAGGEQTLNSYSAESLGEVPQEHWQFLEATLAIFSTLTHFFVHANARPELPLDEQSDLIVYWERFDPAQTAHCSGKIMVCGHTPQKSGIPLNIGHAVCIDTFSYGGGWVTCLEPATGRYWQANQKGVLREAELAKP